MISLLGLDPSTYAPHYLHGADRTFLETNCYTDMWIELVHARGLDPVAMLAFCTVVDFEGDQWTFFKPPPVDLEVLYGMEIQELQVYGALPEHVGTQLALGRFVTIEVDGHYLPDTEGRSYRLTHEKTSVAIEAIDTSAERVRYFHNAGFFELCGEDYRSALRLDADGSAALAPYVELVRSDRLEPCPPERLRTTAAGLLDRQMRLRPANNPVRRFGERLTVDLPSLDNEEAYHLYAFATLRQCGAAWEAAATFLRWLDGERHARAAASFDTLVGSSKTLLFKLARTAASGRSFDPSETIETMADAWDIALDTVCA